MREEMLQRAEEYLARRRHRIRLLRAFTAMALVVAIMTSYVLMLPGLTLQAEAYCGLDEHHHTDDCYTLEQICGETEREPSETVMQLLKCAFEPHVHTEDCRTPEGEIACGISTSYWHRHSAECYNEAGEKVCTLVSNPKHRHTDACYAQVPELVCGTAESEGHQHDDACYTPDRNAEPICGKDDKVGHLHGAGCYVTNQRLVCEIEIIPGTETGDHRHTDACTVLETHLVCPLVEDGHRHEDACYPIGEEPTCGLEMGEGAHAHAETCYTYTRGELICEELAKFHEHSSACYDPETGFVTCGEQQMQEHNHSAACMQSVTAVEEGHAHSDECYERHYTCALPEHTHETSCYDKHESNPEDTTDPEENEAVSTTYIPTAEPTATPAPAVTAEPTVEPEATVEPTAEPEATVEPTAEPEATVEPTVEPEATVEPTAEPEATVEPTAEPEATVEPTAAPEATVEPTAEPETTVEPTAEPEATVEPTVEPEATVEPTPVPSLGPVLDVAKPTYSCGLVAHEHSESCYDAVGALTCGYEQEHVHTLDCQCVCGDEEHYHVDACYDEAGEIVCGIEEHRHMVACALNAQVRETEADITTGRSDFAPYIADSKWNAEDGVEIKNGAQVVYNPETNSYESTLEISFAIPNYVLRGYTYWNGWYWSRVPGQQKFYYNIPDGVYISDSMLDKPFAITSPDGATIEGTFYIRQTDNGEYYLEIKFSDEYVRTANAGYSMPGWPVSQTPYSQGNITFGCSFGSETATEEGGIRIEFTTNDVLVIPPEDIEYPADETAKHNIATEKSGSYIREGNKLYYTVKVHSDKGTPSHIKLEDKLIFEGITMESFGTPVVKGYTSTWNGYAWEQEGAETTYSVVKGAAAGATGTTVTMNTPKQGPAGDIKLDMHLPQITDPGDGKRYTYEITYEINLEDVGLEFNGNGTNTVKAKSENGPEYKVEASASSNVGIYVDSLSKVGSYNQQTDQIKWSITVNGSYQNINGAVLTDQMFTQITQEAAPESIIVKDENGNVLTEGNGFQIKYVDGMVSAIEFFGTSVEDGKEVNRNKYTIEYYTTPSKPNSEYTETNEVELEKGDDKVDETGGAYVKRDLRIYKQTTGATMDGTDRIIDWKSGFTVYDGGLNEDLKITDTISGDNHYMSAEQAVALYKKLQNEDWFLTGAMGEMTLTYKDENGSTATVSAKTVYDSLNAGETTYADFQFTGFSYTIYKDKLPTYLNGTTIEITYQTTADTEGLNGTANYYNGWGVGGSSTGANDQYTYTEIVKVDKLNYWDGNDELNIDTTTGIVEWHVNVTQDKDYTSLTITDTLPDKTKLAYLKFGPFGGTTISLETEDFAEDSDTPINLVVSNYDYHEQGLRVSGTYVPKTGKIELTITPATGADADMQKRGGFGAGQTFKLRVFAEVKDQYINNLEENQTNNIGRITNKVNVSTNEGTYGEDEHSYNVTVKGTATVTKTDGNYQGQDTYITTESGELTWRVNVYQKDNYSFLEIVDTLPPGVELVNVKLGRYTETTASYDATKVKDDGTYDLEFKVGTNDTGLVYTGTYDPATRKVTIKVTPDTDTTTTSEVFGSTKTFTAIYNCKVADSLMPKTEDGEYVKELGKLTNNVQVNIQGGEYGNDSQSQTVTVEKERPVKETVGKNHAWTPSLNLLEYSVDLNPTAADLDPSKNILTVTDKLTFINSPDDYDRHLTLVKSSVKLYYADYDANGVPLRDENGRLIKGREVPYSDWTMAYSETLYENGWQQSDCTMVLTVPDERALILEYDYRVSMNYVPGWDNELRLTNTVSITGYDGVSDSTSWEEKWEEYNAGGIVSTERSLSIVKFDASNHAKLIEGAEFTVYEYDAENDVWNAMDRKYITDGNGNLMVQWQQSATDIQYKENTAYKIVETAPAMGYILDPNAEPIYFYWPNASIATTSLPDNWVDYNPRDLVTNPGHVEVDNTRKTTQVSVAKTWNVTDNSKIPEKLTVHLKRYAVPIDVWEAHPEYNHGLSSTVVSVAGSLRANNTSAYPSFKLMCYAGSTLSFDLLINKDWTKESWGQHEPVFNNLPEGTRVTRTPVGADVVYHYEIPVTESINLDGWFQKDDGTVWSQGWDWDVPEIINVKVSANTTGTVDDSAIAAELDQYRDRNYTNTMTLTADGDWQGVWENLDLVGVDADGKELHYKYYIVEDTPNGFNSKITGGSTDISGSYSLVNTYDASRTEVTTLKVVKIWQDENGDVCDPLEDQVEVRLYQKDELTGREIVFPYNGFPTTVINAATEWTFFFRDLPHGTWDKDGNVTQLYSYRIEEVTKGNFTTQIVAVNAAGVEVLNEELVDATVTVINAKLRDVSATVYKQFEDDAHDEHANCEITVRLDRYVLTQDGYVLDEEHTPESVDLSAENGWKHTWTGLKNGDKDGNSYQYRVTETHVNGEAVEASGYIPVYSTTDGSIPHDGDMTITNLLPDELTITKEWTDIDGEAIAAPAGASVTFELWRTTKEPGAVYAVPKAYDPTVDPGTLVDEQVATFTLNAACSWTKTFTGLPAEDVSGHKYYYYVKEIEIEGYETKYLSNYVGSDDDIVVRNMREETEITYIKINKHWTDLHGNAITPEKYSEVFFKLYQVVDGVEKDITTDLTQDKNDVTPVDGYIRVASDAGWTVTVNGLDANGTYRIVEYLKNNGVYTEIIAASYAPQEGPAGTSFNATNRLTDITVEKVWKDIYGDPLVVPDDKQIVLEVHCRKVDGSTTHLFDVTLPVQQADGSYSWSTTLKELTAGPTDNPVTYFVKEKVVPAGFKVSYSNSTDGIIFNGSNVDPITVTNTQEDVSFSLKKVWQDKSGNEMTPPVGVSIAFNLMRVGTGTKEIENADGTSSTVPDDELIQTVYLPVATVNGDTITYSWEAAFTDLPQTDLNGNVYEYYIVEGASTGMTDYAVTYNPAGSDAKRTAILTDGAEVTITNKLQQKEIKINVMKRWTSGSTAKDVTINVYRYILVQEGETFTKVKDPEVVAELKFSVDDTAAYQTVTGLSDYGTFTGSDGNSYTGDFHYYVEEQNVTEDYTVTYSNDGGTTTVTDPMDASLNTDGNLRVINHERAKLNVRKVWGEGVTPSDKITFKLYREEIPASAIDDGEGEDEFVEVTFRIVTQSDAVLSSVTKTFRKGAKVEWMPTWSSDWGDDWYPHSDRQPQNIVYTTGSGNDTTNTTITFSNGNHTYTTDLSRFTTAYSFNAGYMVESGTVTWTTDNWYQNGGADNGVWTHSFKVDGETEASTYALVAKSRTVGEVTPVASFELDGTAAAAETTGKLTIDGTEYTYVIRDGEWSMLFYDLPVWNADKTSAYIYYVEEIAVGTDTDTTPAEKYLVTYTNNSGVQSGEITITNSKKETEVVEVTVTKAYATGSPTNPPAVEVELYRSVTNGTKTNTERVGTVTLNGDNSWTHTWTDLLKAGTITQDSTAITGDYTYFVKEIVPTGFTEAYSTNGGVVQLAKATVNGKEVLSGAVTITNTPKTGLTVQKTWANNGEEQKEIEFALKRTETLKDTSVTPEQVSIDFQIVIDYTWEGYAMREVLDEHTATFNKGATVDWTPTWSNLNSDWHPETGVVTYNGVTVPFKAPVNEVEKYHYSFHLGKVNESGTVIFIVYDWYWDDPAEGLIWEHSFNKNAGSAISTHKLNTGNNWKMTFYDLPSESTDGVYTYGYEVEELTEGYKVTYDTTKTTVNAETKEFEGTITIHNAKKPPATTFVNVEKKYITDNTDLQSVTVRLYRSITEGGVTLEQIVPDSELQLSTSNNWEHRWRDLPVEGTITGENGVTVTGKFQYRVEEDAVDGYELSYSHEGGWAPNAGTVVITNEEKTEVAVQKQWIDQDVSTAPEIEFNLIQKATPVSTSGGNNGNVTVTFIVKKDGESESYTNATLTVASGSNVIWKPTHYGNLGWSPDGSDGTLTISVVREGASGSQALTVTRGQATETNKDNYYGIIPYTVHVGTVTEDTVVTWTTKEAHAPHPDGGLEYYWEHAFEVNDGIKTTVMSGSPYKLNSANGWTLTIGNLPVASEDGLFTYTYYVEENVPEGYTVEYSNNGGVNSGTINIKNTRPRTQITATKVYAADTNSANIKSVEVQLVRTITQDGVTLEEVLSETKWLNNNESATWSDLPQSGEITKDGVTVHGDYVYSVREKVPLGFNVSYSPNEDGSVANGGTVTITNTEQTQLKVSKEWGSTAQQQEIEFKLWRKRVDNPNKTTCTQCGNTVGAADAHLAKCGTADHYTCDGGDHGVCKLCGKGYACDTTNHGEGICTTPVCHNCGEEVKTATEHVAGCGLLGHYTCDGDNHSAAACGQDKHYNCDGDSHALASCGKEDHYACDGKSHGDCPYCDDGSLACEDGHGNGICNKDDVAICEGCGTVLDSSNSWYHVPAACGEHYMCDGIDHSYHSECGSYKCDGNEHDYGVCYPLCTICGEVESYTGEHRSGVECGNADHCRVDGKTHTLCPYCQQGYICAGGHDDCSSTVQTCTHCQQPITNEADHAAAACGVHYICETGYTADGHKKCTCGQSFVCQTGHTDCSSGTESDVCQYCGQSLTTGNAAWHTDLAACGVHRTCQNSLNHTQAQCGVSGHYYCDQLDHTSTDCKVEGHCKQDGRIHTACPICTEFLCADVDHSKCLVDIEFVVYDQRGGTNTVADSKSVSSIPAGAEITWSITMTGTAVCATDVTHATNCNWAGTDNWPSGASVEKNGDSCVVTFTLAASQSGSVVYYMGYWKSEDIAVSQSITIKSNSGTVTYTTATETAAATLSLRSYSRAVLTSTPRATTESQTVNTSGATDMGTYVLNEGNDWEHIFYELPQYSEDGLYKYEYFVEEITPGYDVSYTNNTGMTEGEITITNNKREPTTKNVTVTKEWVDEGGEPLLMMADTPRYFKLYNGSAEQAVPLDNLSGATLEDGYIKLVTPQFKSSASFTILNLPIGGSYSLREFALVGDEFVEVTDYETKTSGDNAFIVTNMLTDVTIKKVWAPNSTNSTYVKLAVTFELWRTYDGCTEDELVGTKVLASGATTLTWDMLPLTVDGSKVYTYYVKEQIPSGFNVSYSAIIDKEEVTDGSVANGGTVTITNTPTELKVQKQWQNLDGTTVTRTEGTVYYNLMRQKVTIAADGTETPYGDAEKYSTGLTLTMDGNWTASHSGLPVYWKDTTNNVSGEYRYYVVETDKAGNTLPAEYWITSDNVSDDPTTISANVSNKPTITITNTETAISVRKIWSNNGGALPSTLPAITLQLRYTRAEGVKADSDPIVATVTLRANSTGVTVTTQNGNVYWLYTWDHLPAYDLVDGENAARYYYVVETSVPDGFRLVSDVTKNNLGLAGNTAQSGTIEVTNELITYELPETGGAGTTPYTACGILLMTSALTALMYIELKRKKQWGEGRES